MPTSARPNSIREAATTHQSPAERQIARGSSIGRMEKWECLGKEHSSCDLVTGEHEVGCVREQIRAITGHSMSGIDEILKRYTALTIDQAGAALAKLVDHQERQASGQTGLGRVRLFGRLDSTRRIWN